MHRYEEIRAELIQRINAQTWPAGYLLPHEEDLAASFGVARGTIRKALSSLVDAGLIERKRRAGSRVARRTAHASTLRIPNIRQEIESRGGRYTYHLISGEPERQAPEGLRGAKVRHVLCLHLRDGAPYQLEDRLINLDAIPTAANADFRRISPNEWLIAEQPYSAVRTTLRAQKPSHTDARYLHLGGGEPVFVIERQTQLGGVALTDVRLSLPGTAFEITTETADA